MKLTIADIAPKLPLAEARMEVIVADLIEREHIQLNSVSIHPKGLFARGYNQDILQATWQKDKLSLEVCREGLYDMLPKALFHPPKATPTSGILEERLATAEQTAQEEVNARQFFLPFEQEFFRQRIVIEQAERELLGGFSNPVQKMLFNQFFGKADFLSAYQQEILFYLFPLFSEIAGNLELTAKSLSSILGDPVHISSHESHLVSLKSDQPVCLSDAQIGLDWLLGDSVHTELPELTIAIGPIPAENLKKYLPGGNHLKAINCLAGYLLPVELEYQVEIIPEQADSCFTLNNAAHTGRLGFSTAIV